MSNLLFEQVLQAGTGLIRHVIFFTFKKIFERLSLSLMAKNDTFHYDPSNFYPGVSRNPTDYSSQTLIF